MKTVRLIALGCVGLIVLGVAATRLGMLSPHRNVSATELGMRLPAAPQARFPEPGPKQVNPLRLKADFGQLPLSFEPNVGQSDPQVKFLSRGNGYALFLTSDEAVLSPGPVAPTNNNGPHSQSRADIRRVCPAKFELRQQMSRSVWKESALRMRLVGAVGSPHIQGIGRLPGKVNYFLGSDPSAWRTDIPTYTRTKYEAVYPGVDLIFYGNQRQLEYDFVVSARAQSFDSQSPLIYAP